MKQCLLFDLDRTLWDFDGNADRTYRAMFEEFGLSSLCHVDFETFHERYRVINDTLWEAYRNGTLTKELLAVQRFSLTLEAFGCDSNDPDIIRLSRRMGEYYVAEGTRQTGLMPGARELLEWLDTQRDRYTMAVITNGFSEAQLPKMKTSGIDRYFDYFFLSEDLGYMKPDRRFFEAALAKMGAEPGQCIVIGDDYNVDILGAMSAGIPQIYYNRTGKPLPADSPQPTYEIRALSEIQNIVGTRTARPQNPQTEDAAGTRTARPQTQEAEDAAGTRTARPQIQEAEDAAGTRTARPQTQEAEDAAGTRTARPQKPETEEWHCRGYLPHREYQSCQFISYRLYDSVPGQIIEQWKKELSVYPLDERRIKLARLIDKYEDAGCGNCFLKDERVASVVEENLFEFDGIWYDLLRWCIMPNHVHVLINVREDRILSHIVRSWRSYTSHVANKLLDRTGRFWMPEYFDRYIRNDEHFKNVVQYIDNNPVKAGLVDSPEKWRWSSAYYDKR